MKTTKEQRKKLRHTYGGFSEEHNVFLDLLDDLDTQESELTKLRKRVEVLTDALNKCAAWSENRDVDSGFDEPGAAKIAREALNESDKINKGNI